jgi:hypothetical protein
LGPVKFKALPLLFLPKLYFVPILAVGALPQQSPGAACRLRRVTGLQADEIDANGSSIPFLLNYLDDAVAWLFGSTFRFEITVHPAF